MKRNDLKLLCDFFVEGKPATQGSKKYIGNHRIIDACKALPEWRKKVSAVALSNYKHKEPADMPIYLHVVFKLKRPKSHFKSNGTLKDNAPAYPVVKPDLTKMLRAVEDSMSGIVYKDDSCVVSQNNSKVYSTSDVEGVRVIVYGVRNNGTEILLV